MWYKKAGLQKLPVKVKSKGQKAWGLHPQRRPWACFSAGGAQNLWGSNSCIVQSPAKGRWPGTGRLPAGLGERKLPLA